MSIHYRIEHPETMYKIYWKLQVPDQIFSTDCVLTWKYENRCDVITFPQGHTFTTQDIKEKLSGDSSFTLIDIQRL